MAGAAHGGAETAFVDHCLAMAAAGVTVQAVTRDNNPDRIRRLQDGGVVTHCLPFGGRLDLLTRPRLKRLIRAFQPDIVQTWMSRAAQKTPRWTAGMNIPRYAVVARLGGYYRLGHFPAADRFVAIAPDIANHLIASGVAETHVAMIPNFAETEENAPPASRAAEATPADAPLLVALGRLHTAKAFDILIAAMARLPGVHLWIAGEGPERAGLEAQIAALGLSDRVRLLGWRDDRSALLQAANICVFPSRYEPFGTVFVQAWASRTPLVTSAADGPRQFVRDGVDGLVVPIDDTDALASAIRHMLADPGLARRLADAGYARYQAEFTRETVIEAYLSFYRQALAALR